MNLMCIGFELKNFSIVPYFCRPLLFFPWDFSHANNIKKQSNIAKSAKPVIEFSSIRKTDRFDCEIPYTET